MHENNKNKIYTKKGTIIGTFLTIAGGILWGISGVCGQFLFQSKDVTASWLVPLRLVTAGFLLLCYYLIRDKGKAFDIWKTKRNRIDIIIYYLPISAIVSRIAPDNEPTILCQADIRNPLRYLLITE